MLPKKHRITTTQFNAVFKDGVVLRSKHFIVRSIPSTTHFRCAVTVSKKVAPSAVARNTLRRKVYTAIGEIYNKEKNIHGTFIFIMLQKTLPPSDILKEEIKTLLSSGEDRQTDIQ